jgi:transcriptional regulator with XRE-family HTH domain
MSTTATPHIGRKISRIRELRGMKQEALALELGVSQQTVSHMEQSETIEDEKLEKVAKVLGVTPDAIKNFSEEKAINYFNNVYDNDFSNSTGALAQSSTFNPLDKLMEAVEENKKLYERLLAAEKEKVSYLEKLLDKN